MKPIKLGIVLALAAVAGCASVPDPLEGEEYTEAFYPEQAAERSLGAKVRWGGTVVETRPESERTCVEILAQELGRDSRPQVSDTDYGRFIACRDGFIDPEIYVNGREVTVVGEVARFQDGKVGDFDYEYPLVSADALYLWPQTSTYPGYGGYYPYYGVGHYYRPYYGGFHGLHGGLHGGFHGGFHGRYRHGGYLRSGSSRIGSSGGTKSK